VLSLLEMKVFSRQAVAHGPVMCRLSSEEPLGTRTPALWIAIAGSASLAHDCGLLSSQGHVLGASAAGPWPILGRIFSEKQDLTAKSVDISFRQLSK
jgi:hypothetical protein